MPRSARYALALSAAALAAAAPLVQAAEPWSLENWPTKHAFADGTELSATANWAYDTVDFSGDRGYGSAATALRDSGHYRRREFGMSLKKKDVYDFTAIMDFQSNLWLDVALRMETKALFGSDFGRIRVGYIKTPVGLDGVTSSRAGSFMEVALPVQAVYAGRRTGIEWTYEQPKYYLQAGAYGGKDLQGDNPGTMQALRGVWTPIKANGDVLHLGLSASVENPRGYHNGRDEHFDPSGRLRARPEAGLTDIRLVDSGTLTPVDQIRRAGFEGIWIHGPFSVQAEALQAKVTRDNGLLDYNIDGQYIYGSWILTGESRPYAAGAVANVKPAHAYGAVELLARYSRLDLQDNGIDGGRQHDWTFGANWYLTSHFKFQANYVKADASRRGVHTTPDIWELRAQVMF